MLLADGEIDKSKTWCDGFRAIMLRLSCSAAASVPFLCSRQSLVLYILYLFFSFMQYTNELELDVDLVLELDLGLLR